MSRVWLKSSGLFIDRAVYAPRIVEATSGLIKVNAQEQRIGQQSAEPGHKLNTSLSTYRELCQTIKNLIIFLNVTDTAV